ncbi:rhodanese-like domain-containing protein [Alteromonas sp. 1_MG-2023]|uniref:rhodanese-like domain-containing protein n=1 Tax=Alteromonas sp. 1_MG-2023 TaxID=3062669 RepID=UPI0026E47990|nr:rhodanese-like domain-containing protein [Alteromonas sp. 1_MG-2023]MDO6567672.1 rhodanese-like domain-containing protein [Alteromonas sp. 1_MG-2023]
MLIDIPTRLANIAFPLRCITAKEATQEISSNHGLLIDVREPAEATSSPVPAAINIPRGVLEMKVLEKCKDAKFPIYIHCASGIRAKLAAEQLMSMGYENISVVTCSISDINVAAEA